MLDHLGHPEAHGSIMAAIESTLRSGANLTPDMGGRADTQQLGKEIADAIK